jgi:hypothetical protein
MDDLRPAWNHVGDRNDVDQLAVEPQDRALLRRTQRHRPLGNSVEDRLHVGWRARDDPEDVACCRLLLERLGHLSVSASERIVLLLNFCEKADILNGDHCLIGERLQEFDLLVGEGTDLASADEDCANAHVPTQEGSAESRAPPAPAGEISPDGKVVGHGYVFDMDNPRLAHRISCHRAVYRLASADRRRERAVVSTDDELVAVDGPEYGIDRTTHDAGSSHNRVEH